MNAQPSFTIPVQSRYVKKCPNRRLYDFKLRRYITLEELREFLLQGEDIRVYDVLQNDVTAEVYAGIVWIEVATGRAKAEPLLQLIRTWGSSRDLPDETAEVARLRTALMRYGEHDGECPGNANLQDPSKCTCGLSNAIGPQQEVSMASPDPSQR